MFDGFRRWPDIPARVVGHIRQAVTGASNLSNIRTNGNSNVPSPSPAGRSMVMAYPLEPESTNHLCYSLEDFELLLNQAEEIDSWTNDERRQKWREFSATHRAQRGHTEDEWIWLWERQVLPVLTNGLDDSLAVTAGELHARQEKDRIRHELRAMGFKINPSALYPGSFFYAPDQYTITPGEEEDEPEDGQFEMETSVPGRIVMPDGVHNIKIRKWLSLKDIGDAVICLRTTTRTGRGLDDLTEGSRKWMNLVRLISQMHDRNRTFYRGGVGYWAPLVLDHGQSAGHDESMLEMRIFTIKKTEFVQATNFRLMRSSEDRLAEIYRYATQLGSYFRGGNSIPVPTFALNPRYATHTSDYYDSVPREQQLSSREPHQRNPRRRSKSPQGLRDDRHRSRSPRRDDSQYEKPLPPLPPPASRYSGNGDRAKSFHNAVFGLLNSVQDTPAADSQESLGRSRRSDNTSRIATLPAIAPPAMSAHHGKAPAKASRGQAVKDDTVRPESSGPGTKTKGKQKQGSSRESVDPRGDMTKIADQMQKTTKIRAGTECDESVSHKKKRDNRKS